MDTSHMPTSSELSNALAKLLTELIEAAAERAANQAVNEAINRLLASQAQFALGEARKEIPQVMSVSQAADWSGIPKSTLYRLIREQRIESTVLAGRIRIHTESLAAYLEGER
jgi:excisionase family DNA binding protein